MLRSFILALTALASSLTLVSAPAAAQDDPNYWSGSWRTPFNVIAWRRVSDAEGRAALAGLQPDSAGVRAQCGRQAVYYRGDYRNNDGQTGVHAACTSGNLIQGRFRDTDGDQGWYRAGIGQRTACAWSGVFRPDGTTSDLSWSGQFRRRVPNDGGPNVCVGDWRFNVSTYANDVRIAPPLVAWHQLCVSRLRGSGDLAGDGGAIDGEFTQEVLCPSRPGGPRNSNVSLTHRLISGKLTVTRTRAGLARVLVGKIRVTSARRPDLCPVGTVGQLILRDDPRKQKNGEKADAASTHWPQGVRCPEQGWDNRDAPAAQPRKGGPPDGGHWAIVTIR